MVINVVAFVIFGIDKSKARRGKWRIPESTLILFSIIGGAAGSLLGMLLFHHKTRHGKFCLLVPLSLVLWIALLAWFFLGQ